MQAIRQIKITRVNSKSTRASSTRPTRTVTTMRITMVGKQMQIVIEIKKAVTASSVDLIPKLIIMMNS